MIKDYFENLDNSFRDKVLQLLDTCDRLGYTMYPFCGFRSPQVQACYWGKGRCQEDINHAVNYLLVQKANYLAEIMATVLPDESAEIVTHALPGLSWHQWGGALDCFWLVGEEQEWDHTRKINGFSGYEIYAKEATKLGLTAGFNWETFKDAVHIQFTSNSSPLDIYTWEEIDMKMKELTKKE